MSISPNTKLSPNKALAALYSTGRAKKSAFLWGPPGIGKSDIVRELGKRLSTRDSDGNVVEECEVKDVRLLLMDPTDLRGIPHIVSATGKMQWSEPSALPDEFVVNPAWVKATANLMKDVYGMLMRNDNYRYVNLDGTESDLTDADLPERLIPNKRPVILFLDELTAAPPAVQAAAYQLVLDRKVGDYNLPENCIVVAAGNRQEDRGVVFTMPTPLANRFVHIDMTHDSNEWLDWAINNRVHPNVLGFISSASSKLFQFDPQNSDANRAFATPRSWVAVSDLEWVKDKYGTDAEVHNALIEGTVGIGIGNEYNAWISDAQGLPSAKDVISGKVTKMPTRGSTKKISGQFYVVANVCYEMYELNERTKNAGSEGKKEFDVALSNVSRFLLGKAEDGTYNFSDELQIMALRLMLNKYHIDMDMNNPDFDAAITKHAEIVIKAIAQ